MTMSVSTVRRLCSTILPLTRTAYQSALLTTPLLLLILIFNLLIRLPKFFRIIILIGSIGTTGWAAFRAWKDAQDGLGRYWLPYIGEMAEKWVNEE